MNKGSTRRGEVRPAYKSFARGLAAMSIGEAMGSNKGDRTNTVTSKREGEGVCVCMSERDGKWGSDRINCVRCRCDTVGTRIRNGRSATRCPRVPKYAKMGSFGAELSLQRDREG